MKTKRTYKLEVEIEAETIPSGIEFLSQFSRTAGLGADWKHVPQNRSLEQNSALHLFCDMVAMEAQSKGLTLDALYKNPTEVPITSTHLKTFAKDVTATITGNHNKTSKLSERDFSVLVEVLVKTFAERLDSEIPFPTKNKK